MTLKSFIFGAGLAFALPWVVIVAGPYGSLSSVKPVAYDEEADGQKGFYPATRAEANGQHVFIANGCAQCHTQVIRRQVLGAGDGDEYKKGWGSDQESGAPVQTRATTAYDYIGEDYAAIGQRRVGPDLANAGYRLKGEAAIYRHLFNPQAKFDWSSCPSQRQMFEVQKVESHPVGVAVTSIKGLADDEQALPLGEAKALASYLLSLKRAQVLPVSLGGKPAAEDGAAATAKPAATPAK
jgi:cytochrome c oxidase cbb3-type subunit II